MDKYFEESYDPRLDVSVAEMTDPYGFIAEGNFDEWSHMIDVLKIRREEKNFRAAEKEAEDSLHSRRWLWKNILEKTNTDQTLTSPE